VFTSLLLCPALSPFLLDLLVTREFPLWIALFRGDCGRPVASVVFFFTGLCLCLFFFPLVSFPYLSFVRDIEGSSGVLSPYDVYPPVVFFSFELWGTLPLLFFEPVPGDWARYG